MKRILVVGAGQIGSRHLQALKAVKVPLQITVVDSLPESLTRARSRFDESVPKEHPHRVSFVSEIPKIDGKIDLAIVATRSDTRRGAIDQIFKKNSCDAFFLEKLLFQKPGDYRDIQILFENLKVKAWVNCTMRTIPFYAEMKKDGPLNKINYTVGSGETGLITSIVHFLDHMAYLTNCLDFSVDTSLLEPKSIESKREGFLELIGTIRVTFMDGSFGSFTRYPEGTEPSLVTISNKDVSYMVKETEEKALISKRLEKWQWKEILSPIPLQSIMTTWLVEEILSTGKCRAVSFEDSSKIHLQILEPLRQFLNQNGGNYDYFPFT